MSKYVKQLMTDELKSRWDGVNDALLVDVSKLEANDAVVLRRRLREKNISLMVVKNSLARRASEGTTLAPAFEGAEGTMAVAWGGEDIVSLAKEIVAVKKDKAFEEFEARGGVMDGAKLSADDVTAVSKWPSRGEQLSILMGQILGPGMTLNAQLLGPGASLGSQIKQKGEGDEE
ncbi:50S ribosomal protein L10 [Posidoniimonas polymericola]|uniref:Large ribosomal subunit protein uL10 n=1 Tax=Posidoniimonas polymericola TaxID=2528002 RepID=A0A5C5YFS5_9BACT|nr:50S ribosomal protein L10 [Posidoniimonas polymericola]TWT73643.1 50S ribosomal protein L10 [Posidoniimonas polymericola]